MYYATITFSSNATVNVPPPPTCGTCGAPPVTQTREDGRLWCAACLEAENQRRAIATAENWMTAAFFAVARDQRARVYKQLAVLFHPDQGGNPQLMIALNNVRDRFR